MLALQILVYSVIIALIFRALTITGDIYLNN